MGCSGGAGVTTPALVWPLNTRSAGTTIHPPLPADPDARICSSSAPAPALIPATRNASSWGPQKCLGESPEKGAEPGELFSRSHFIIVAKETSSQDIRLEHVCLPRRGRTSISPKVP